MGYGIILGGGADLNYGWVNSASYATLPSGKPVNTLGFITSTAVPNVYWKNSTVTGLVTGDVVMREGVYSSTPFNIVSAGQLYVYPTGAYQYNGSVLVPIDCYWYSGSAWTLCAAIFYNEGTIPANVNDYLAYKSGGTTATITKNADNVQFSLTSASGWGYSQYAIDFTYITKLWVRAKVTAPSMFVGTIPAYNSSTGLVSVSVSETVTYADYSLDVSAVTGNQYIAFGLESSTSRYIYINKLWGV